MKTLLQSISLAFRDWLFERTLSLCAVLALAAMLAPILVLEGLDTCLKNLDLVY